ncbi:MAG: hypothetical protein EOP49_01420 [Sphingobacteriales bacterium]|nr:MAG: hypothetical protein EOP49_01420 [Sphingobacteriales bacterium]
MKWLNRILTVFMIGFFVVGAPYLGFAQPVDPGCDPLDPACPIDGGLSLLIAAGIGIGAKKAYDAKRNTQGNKDQ